MFDVNNYLSIAVHGAAGKHGEGVAGTVEQFLAFLEKLTTKSPAGILDTLFPGISALANIHPLFVHFPIALFSFFVLIDLVGSLFGKTTWRQAASWFLYLGTLMAGVTVAAGFEAAATVPHGDDVHNIMERHKYLGVSILTLAAVLSLWRLFSKGQVTGGGNVLYLIFAVILGLLVVFAADLGGLMVYKYGVAVETANPSMLNYFHQHQHAH